MIDTGPVGLRMFDLGSIPASVTPPRTWRRAAWFTVVASLAALAGLLAVGAVLVSPAQPPNRLVAAPYFPNGTPLLGLGGPPSSSVPPRDSDGSPIDHAGHVPTPTRVTEVGDTAPLVSTPLALGGTSTRRFGAVTPPPSLAPGSIVVTLPAVDGPGGVPAVDPTQLIKRTRTFFAEVTSNAQAAAQLTTGAARADAITLIQQKYGAMASIQIEGISLDPTSGLTICLLRVVNKDGSTQNQQITLQFTLSGDPKITNPGG